ncbi:MAG: D-2-hydroxyacid dehydrogenase [Gammaproteobacteria bacterium]
MSQHQSDPPAVFVAAHDAEAYRDLITAELGGAVPVDIACSRSAVTAGYQGQPIILGSPDYLTDLLETRPPVQWVQSTWAGVAPLLKLNFRDYQLTGVKGIFGPQMAEYVFSYLLAHEIGIARRFREQQAHHWDDVESGSLRGKVLGIMGTGSIGRYLAKTALAFAMVPIGFNTRGASVEPFDEVYCRRSIQPFLARCDHLVSILPDTPATNNLLDAEAFARMKDTAVLINAGRGNLIDEKALCRALAEQQLAGAVLDVFRQEPLPPDSPLWDTPELKITGHIAAVSQPRDIVRLFAENYRLFNAGNELRYLVDFARGY